MKMRRFFLAAFAVFAALLLAVGCSSKKTPENLPDGDLDSSDLDAIEVHDPDGQEPDADETDADSAQDTDADSENDEDSVHDPEGIVSGSYMMPDGADGKKAALFECGESEELASAEIKNGGYELKYDLEEGKSYCVEANGYKSCFEGGSYRHGNISPMTHLVALSSDTFCGDLRGSETAVRSYLKVATGIWLGELDYANFGQISSGFQKVKSLLPSDKNSTKEILEAVGGDIMAESPLYRDFFNGFEIKGDKKEIHITGESSEEDLTANFEVGGGNAVLAPGFKVVWTAMNKNTEGLKNSVKSSTAGQFAVRARLFEAGSEDTMLTEASGTILYFTVKESGTIDVSDMSKNISQRVANGIYAIIPHGTAITNNGSKLDTITYKVLASGDGESVAKIDFGPDGTSFSGDSMYLLFDAGTLYGGDATMLSARRQEADGSVSVLNSAMGDPIMMSAMGDPIMMSAGGEPIMSMAMGDPIMMSAMGDPIMMTTGMGDPIMGAAMGDPIMGSAMGDPIMGAAMGDPIMMGTCSSAAMTQTQHYSSFLLDAQALLPTAAAIIEKWCSGSYYQDFTPLSFVAEAIEAYKADGGEKDDLLSYFEDCSKLPAIASELSDLLQKRVGKKSNLSVLENLYYVTELLRRFEGRHSQNGAAAVKNGIDLRAAINALYSQTFIYNRDSAVNDLFDPALTPRAFLEKNSSKIADLSSLAKGAATSLPSDSFNTGYIAEKKSVLALMNYISNTHGPDFRNVTSPLTADQLICAWFEPENDPASCSTVYTVNENGRVAGNGTEVEISTAEHIFEKHLTMMNTRLSDDERYELLRTLYVVLKYAGTLYENADAAAELKGGILKNVALMFDGVNLSGNAVSIVDDFDTSSHTVAVREGGQIVEKRYVSDLSELAESLAVSLSDPANTDLNKVIFSIEGYGYSIEEGDSRPVYTPTGEPLSLDVDVTPASTGSAEVITLSELLEASGGNLNELGNIVAKVSLIVNSEADGKKSIARKNFEVVVDNGEHVAVNTKPAGADVSVRLVGSDGSPIEADANPALLVNPGNKVFYLGEDGLLSVSDVTPATYTITGQADGYYTASVSINVSEGSTHDVELKLDREVTGSGTADLTINTLINSLKRPQIVYIQLYNDDMEMIANAQAQVNSDGGYAPVVLNEIGYGRYTLAAVGQEMFNYVSAVTVSEEGDNEFDMLIVAENACGNGIVDGGEDCDPGSGTTQSLTCGALFPNTPNKSAAVSCDPVSCVYDKSGCGKEPLCGDGILDAGETCDGSTKNCSDVMGEIGLSGNAACKSDCSGWNTESCAKQATCTVPELPDHAQPVVVEETLVRNGESWSEPSICEWQCQNGFEKVDEECLCPDGQHDDGDGCVSNTGETLECENLPENARWTNGTYTPVWNDGWTTAPDPVYDETGASACSFACGSDSHYDGSLCVSDNGGTQSCGTLPANAEWVNGGTYESVWNGTAYTTASAHYAEEGDCAFICKSTFTWSEDNAGCVCPEDEHPENGSCVSDTGDARNCENLPANAEWVISTYTPHWANSAWSTEPAATYTENGGDECTYDCADNFHFDGNNCASDNGGTVSCGTLPANAAWVDGDTYESVWDGSAYTSASAHYAEEGDCAFLCNATYEWIDGACTCGSGKHVEGGLCTSDTQAAASCGTLPDNTEWVGDGTYIPTWNGTGYSTASAHYAEDGDCAYKCLATYTWTGSGCNCTDAQHVENGSCVSNTQAAASCGTLPDHAAWVNGSTYIPTWDGSEYSSASAHYAEDGDCAFKCDETFEWIDESCTCGSDMHIEGGVCTSDTQAATSCGTLPDNAEWVGDGTYIPTWNGTDYSTAEPTYSDSGECAFQCKPTFMWNNNSRSCRCPSSQHIEEDSCVSNTGDAQNCTALPANAIWVNPTYTPHWANSAWSTEPEAEYFENGGSECTFECVANFHYEGSSCQSDTKPAQSCGTLPDNAEWVGDGTYIPTWNGTDYSTAEPTYSDSGECAFQCKPTFMWNNNSRSCRCPSSQHIEEDSCVSNTGDAQNCTALPANAIWVNPTYTPHWANSAWSTEPEAEYFENGGSECTFECVANFHYEGSSCQSDSKPAQSCGTLPDNAEWLFGSTYIPVWTGEGYTSASPTYLESSPEVVDCAFRCKSTYSWIDSNCTCTGDQHVEGGLCTSNTGEAQNCANLPANASWVASTYTPVWNGSAWTSEPAATYFENQSNECTYECVTDYHYEEESCQSDTKPPESCGELPDNASWVNGSTYIPTWNGKGYPYLTAHYAEEGDCAFKCVDEFVWNLDTVSCEPEPRCGDGILNGDEECDDGDGQNGEYGFCKLDCSECTDDEFHIENGHCLSNAGRQTECEGELPQYSRWINNTYYSYWITTGNLGSGDGYWYTPELTYSYEDEYAECSFRCLDGFEWNEEDEVCECPEERPLNTSDPENPYCELVGQNVTACSPKPENTVWTDNGQQGMYILEMTGAPTTHYSYGDICDCCYSCAEGFHYLDEQGVCESDIRDPEPCTDLPDNAVWVGSGYYTPVWTGEIWTMPNAVYDESGESDCSFRCPEYYEWSYASGMCGLSIPECSQSSGTPCHDTTNKITWSPLSAGTMDWDSAVSYCDNLDMIGYTDWRLPTIDELRTLVRSCSNTQTDGACAISDPNALAYGNYVANNCQCEPVENNEGLYSIFGDNDTVTLWSSSEYTSVADFAWYLDFANAGVSSHSMSGSYNVRCAR